MLIKKSYTLMGLWTSGNLLLPFSFAFYIIDVFLEGDTLTG